MGSPLVKYLEGNRGRSLPGGSSRSLPGGAPQPKGFSGVLEKIGPRSGRTRTMPVYQPRETPTPVTPYVGKAGGEAAIGPALKGIGGIMLAIENYQAAKMMQERAMMIEDEERKAAALKAAQEQMDAARAVIDNFKDGLQNVPEEERAAYIKGAEQSVGAQFGDGDAVMNMLRGALGAGGVLPSDATLEGDKSKAGATGELSGYGAAMDEPGVREYLASKKSGVNVTTNIDAKPVPVGLVQDQVESESLLSKVKWIKENFKPEYVGKLTGGDVDGLLMWGKEKAGRLSQEEEQWFRAVAGLKNAKIKLASGATVPVSEVPRLMEEIGTIWDSKGAFPAKMNVLLRNVEEEMGIRARRTAEAGYKNISGGSTENIMPTLEEIQTETDINKLKEIRRRLQRGGNVQ